MDEEEFFFGFDPFKRMGEFRRWNDWLSEFKPMRVEGKTFRQPLVDLIEEGKQLRLVAELPGLEKKDIAIQVQEQSITIAAKTSHAEEEKRKGYYYSERRAEQFYRRLSLPSPVVPEKASAEYKNGILEVSLPKREPSKPKPSGFKLQVK